MAEEVMKLVKAVFVAVLSVTSTSVVTSSRAEAAPLQNNAAAMKAALETQVEEVRYGRGHGRWGGYRGWGYRSWGLGAAAGAVVGGAIARSAYYGGSYPYYDRSYAYPYYGGGYAYDYCRPYASTGYYPAPHYYGW
jgi:hypothetical protein